MYLAIYLSFQGNFVIDKYLKMATLEPFSCSVFFAARTRTTANLKLEQKQFFFLICISIAREIRTGL